MSNYSEVARVYEVQTGEMYSGDQPSEIVYIFNAAIAIATASDEESAPYTMYAEGLDVTGRYNQSSTTWKLFLFPVISDDGLLTAMVGLSNDRPGLSVHFLMIDNPELIEAYIDVISGAFGDVKKSDHYEIFGDSNNITTPEGAQKQIQDNIKRLSRLWG
jgi:hypothetical protein